MSNTSKVHKRFWATMGERFGKRWLDEYGDEPTKAWSDLIDRFTPDEIANALLRLKDRPESARSHPPTHGEFESMLGKAQRAHASDGTDYVRAYWRSVIVETCMRHAALLNIVSHGEKQLGALPAGDVRDVAIALMRQQLDWACDTERRNGQRTEAMTNAVDTELWHALRIFRRAEPPAVVLEPPAQQLQLETTEGDNANV